MYPIDGPGHNNNRFTSGNVERGVEPTTLTTKWANDVQDELLNLIKECGIDPSKHDNTQVLRAIKRITGYDFVCRSPYDLETILDTNIPDGYRIRVDVDQILKKVMPVLSSKITIESRQIGIKIEKGSESKFLPEDAPFLCDGDFFSLSGFIVNGFRFAVRFNKVLQGGEVTRCYLNSDLPDVDTPIYAGRKPAFFISANNFRAGE